MLHEANTATNPSSPVSSTNGALRPSTPRKYSTLNESMGIQPGARSTSWTPPFARSYEVNTRKLRRRSRTIVTPATSRTCRSLRTSTAISSAPTSGRNTVSRQQSVALEVHVCRYRSVTPSLSEQQVRTEYCQHADRNGHAVALHLTGLYLCNSPPHVSTELVHQSNCAIDNRPVEPVQCPCDYPVEEAHRDNPFV